MIKLMQIIHGFNTGGAETLVMDYALLLDKTKFDISIICIEHRDSPYEEMLRKAGVNVIYLCDYFANRFTKRIGIKKLFKKVLKDIHPDIVHCHLTMNSYIKYAKPEESTKYFYTQHNEISRLKEMHPKEIKTIRWIVKKYDSQLIAINEQMKIELNHLFKVDNTVVLYNGIDLDKYKKPINRNAVRENNGIPRDAFVIVHVGRFDEVKNHLFLVDVFKFLKKKNDKAFLLMIGTGKTIATTTEKLEYYGLKDSFTILQNRMDVPELLLASDAALFPSKSEGLGMALIEMQAAKLPVIASQNIPQQTCISNYIRYISLSENPETWANCLLNLYDISKNSKSVDLANWDIKQSVKKLEKLYIESLHKNN